MDNRKLALIELGMSAEEAEQVLADDKRIDKGEKLFELSDEQKKNAKQARNGAKLPTVYKFSQRQRKADNDKRFLVERLADSLFGLGENLQIENPEREIIFLYNGKKYKITLSAPRS